LLLFDLHAMSASYVRVAQVAAEKYVMRHMRAQDLVAVAVYGRNFQLLQPFTGDPAKVLEAVRKPLASFGASAIGIGFQGSEGIQLAKNAIRTLSTLCTDLAQLKGRKSVLIFTQDFAVPSGPEFPLLVEQARKAQVSFYTLIVTGANASIPLGPPGSAKSLQAAGDSPSAGSPSSPVGSKSFSAGIRPAAAGSAGRVDTPEGNGPAATVVEARAKASGAVSELSTWRQWLTGVLSTLGVPSVTHAAQAPGPPTNVPTGPTGTGIADSSVRDSATILDYVTAGADSMQALAKETWGDVVREANDLNRALDEFDLSLSNYYVLGFLSDGAGRRVQKVEVRTPGLKDVRLSYLRQFYPGGAGEEPRAPAPPPRRLREALEAGTSSQATTLGVRALVFYADAELAEVTMRVQTQPEGAKLKDQAGSAVWLLGAVLNQNGEAVARFEKRNPLESGADGGAASAHHTLWLKPGRFTLKLLLGSENGPIAFGQAPLVVSSLPSAGLATSSLVVTEGLSPLPDFIRNAPPSMVDERYPFVFKGYAVTPSVANAAARQKPLAFFYEVYNLRSAASASTLVSEARFTDQNGQSFLLAPVSHVRTVQAIGPQSVALGFTLPVGGLPAGKYRVSMRTSDSAARESVESETEVVLQ
jgi:VWFA-related protein